MTQKHFENIDQKSFWYSLLILIQDPPVADLFNCNSLPIQRFKKVEVKHKLS